jgi:hypothetical protein
MIEYINHMSHLGHVNQARCQCILITASFLFSKARDDGERGRRVPVLSTETLTHSGLTEPR